MKQVKPRAGIVIANTLDLAPCHRARTVRGPASTRDICCAEMPPIQSVSSFRSTVRTWETFTTLSRSRPVVRARKRTLPGDAASSRLLVIAATITVWIRLMLKASDWITNTGRRQPGPEPKGTGTSAHQTSPRIITNLLLEERAFAFGRVRDRPLPRSGYKARRAKQSFLQAACDPETRLWLAHRACCAKRRASWRLIQPF
jgi:hypothetical protein